MPCVFTEKKNCVKKLNGILNLFLVIIINSKRKCIYLKLFLVNNLRLKIVFNTYQCLYY